MSTANEIDEAQIERVAVAIYMTHWREPSPIWDNASTAVKDWVRKQAVSAIKAMPG